MSNRYPHLKDTQYPDLANANVWQYENNFDFAQFDDIQMHIKICSVPWDIGEVHIGLKSIPMGNVVGWNSKAERDAYLDGLQGMEWDTNYRAYHDGDTIKLPVPFEYMSYYNYLVVDYSKPPVNNADGTGIIRFLYFIRDLNQLSINNTQCTIWRDSWSMFVNDISFSHMVLERGHYAVAKSATVEDYLMHPISNTDYLLTPDVSYGVPSKSYEAGKFVINDSDCVYVIASTAFVQSENWGEYQTDGWRIPATPFTNTEQTSPAYSIIGIEGANIGTFWEAVRTKAPQYMESVKAVYLMPTDMVTVIEGFTFCGVQCFKLRAVNPTVELANITKDAFGYGEYKEITKLYTAPYCHLELTDGEGKDVRINVEDTSSNVLQLANYVSIAYPYAAVTSYLKGVGNSDDKTVTYKNLSSRNFNYSGKWWDYWWKHDIPTFAIIVGGKTRSTYNGWYSREGSKEQTAKSADCNYTISKQNAAISRQMAKNSAQGAKDSTSTQNAANKTLSDYANEQVTDNTQADVDYNEKIVDNNNFTTKSLAEASASATTQTASITANASVQTAANEASAGITNSVINGVAGVGTGAVNGFASGGQLGAAAGAISGVISGAAGIGTAAVNAQMTNTNASINAGATMSAANVAANLTTNQANKSTSNDTSNYLASVTNMEAKRDITKAYNTKTRKTNNDAAESITSINANVTSNNAQRQYIAVMSGTADSLGTGYAAAYTVEDGNGSAQLARATAKEMVNIANKASEREQWLQAPVERGMFANGEFDVVKPAGVWCNVVTQPFDCIAQAGQQMLRYGYTYDGSVDFTTFNVMKKFSYWKVADIWCNGQNIPDAWVDDVRNLLLRGVTVWSKPEYINTTSIYDNERA